MLPVAVSIQHSIGLTAQPVTATSHSPGSVKLSCGGSMSSGSMTASTGSRSGMSGSSTMCS